MFSPSSLPKPNSVGIRAAGGRFLCVWEGLHLWALCAVMSGTFWKLIQCCRRLLDDVMALEWIIILWMSHGRNIRIKKIVLYYEYVGVSTNLVVNLNKGIQIAGCFPGTTKQILSNTLWMKFLKVKFFEEHFINFSWNSTTNSSVHMKHFWFFRICLEHFVGETNFRRTPWTFFWEISELLNALL